MKILVVNGYVRQNKGDAALMSVLCRELQKVFPTATIKISSQEDPVEYPTFESWQNIGSLMRYAFDPQVGKIRHFFRLLLCGLVIELLGRLPQKLLSAAILPPLPASVRVQFAEMNAADLIVSMGGGYLNGNRSLMANACVYLMLAPLRLGKQFGVCVVCAPQSMGPFATAFQNVAVKRTLENVDLILTREAKTTELLAAISRRFSVVQSVDLGFLFEVDEVCNVWRQWKIGHSKLLVGVTVRRWLEPKRQRAYENTIAKVTDYLISQYGARVVFIPQVTSLLGGDDDRVTSRNVYAKLKNKDNALMLEDDYSHQQIKAIYNALDLIIGTRFHSVIFSLTSYVPALAIEYEHKTSGIMHDLALDKWVVKIEAVTAKLLIHKIDQLMTARGEYKRYLRKTIPAYITRAREAAWYIQQAYATSHIVNTDGEGDCLTLTHDHVVELND